MLWSHWRKRQTLSTLLGKIDADEVQILNTSGRDILIQGDTPLHGKRERRGFNGIWLSFTPIGSAQESFSILRDVAHPFGNISIGQSRYLVDSSFSVHKGKFQWLQVKSPDYLHFACYSGGKIAALWETMDPESDTFAAIYINKTFAPFMHLLLASGFCVFEYLIAQDPKLFQAYSIQFRPPDARILLNYNMNRYEPCEILESGVVKRSISNTQENYTWDILGSHRFVAKNSIYRFKSSGTVPDGNESSLCLIDSSPSIVALIRPDYKDMTLVLSDGTSAMLVEGLVAQSYAFETPDRQLSLIWIINDAGLTCVDPRSQTFVSQWFPKNSPSGKGTVADVTFNLHFIDHLDPIMMAGLSISDLLILQDELSRSRRHFAKMGPNIGGFVMGTSV